MPDTGHQNEPAIRHCRSHVPEIRRRNPPVALAPQYQMRMMDLRHTPPKLAAFPLASQIHRRADPDALGNAMRLFQNSLEQRLDLSVSIAEPRDYARRERFRQEQGGGCSRH